MTLAQTACLHLENALNNNILHDTRVCAPHLASVVDDAKICLVLQLLRLLELGVGALLLHHLLHETLVRGFGEPALLVQQGQDARRACLEGAQHCTGQLDPKPTNSHPRKVTAWFTETQESHQKMGSTFLTQEKDKEHD